MRRRPRRLLVSALFTGLCAGSWIAPRWGQEVDDTPRYPSSRPYQSEVEAANPRPSNFHVAGGLDVRDQYFFRGYNRASSGVIIQRGSGPRTIWKRRACRVKAGHLGRSPRRLRMRPSNRQLHTRHCHDAGWGDATQGPRFARRQAGFGP